MPHRIDWLRQRVSKAAILLEVGSAENVVWAGTGHKVTTLDKSIRPEEKCFPDVVGLAEALPFPNNSYDIACLSELLEHVESPQVVLAEAIRVAKKRVILTVPFEGRWTPDLKPFWNPGHVRFYDIDSFAKELSQTKLPYRIEEIVNGPWVWIGGEIYCEGKNMVKINLGSFVDTIGYGWQNWDLLPVEKHIKEGHLFRQWDVRNGIPLADNSVHLYHMSHLLEHLTLEEAHNLLAELWRTLKPGGLVRISTPDARTIVRRYLQDDMAYFNAIQPPEFISALTQGEKLSRILFSGDYAHRGVYDFEMLKAFLVRVGFSPDRIFRMPSGESQSDVMKREMRDQHQQISLYCEGLTLPRLKSEDSRV